jgi:2,4-dienoyl-CoA reductase-like NADH-dependent reductase (Old Yellow Enzyme family)
MSDNIRFAEKDSARRDGDRMEEKLVDTIRLENRLSLEIYDASRRVAGDRWQVRMIARVPIDLSGDLFLPASDSGPGFEEMIDTLGSRVLFEYRAERNFVDEKEKEGIFDSQKATFLISARAYLENPDFPRRFAERKYREALDRRLPTDTG